MTAEGVSRYPCSQIYCGPEAASEPETRAVQDEARRLVTSESGSRLRGWLTMHAYGRMWMFPYGTHVKHSPDLPCNMRPTTTIWYALATVLTSVTICFRQLIFIQCQVLLQSCTLVAFYYDHMFTVHIRGTKFMKYHTFP